MAAEQIFFVTHQTLVAGGYIAGNVNAQIVRSSIIRCQDRFIEPILGSPLYEDLLDKVKNATTNADEDLLLDKYIRPLLTAHVEVRVSRRVTTQIRNKTTGSASDDTITATDNEGLTDLRDDIAKDIRFYADKLIGFLKDNEDTYPLYKLCRNNYEDVEKQVKPNRTVSFLGRTNPWVRIHDKCKGYN